MYVASKRYYLTFVLTFVLYAGCIAQIPPATFVNPAGLPVPSGYSTSVRVDLGNSTMIIISGLVSMDKNKNIVGKGDLGLQTEQVFRNMKLLMAEAGGTMDDVVKLGYFVTDISKIQTVRDVRDRYINVRHPPASTAVEIRKLVRDEFLIEIEATAIIPKTARP